VRFFLGTHKANWLAKAGVPLFVSRRTLAPMKTLPRAIAPWALDSGGFTELQMHGRWTVTARDYALDVRRLRDEVGMLEWAAPQDWMCEENMLKRTGLTVAEHQRRTTANYLELRSIAPDLPWIPVLQGWAQGEYMDHVEAYSVAGVDLTSLPRVGIGTVCRRQATTRAAIMIASFLDDGIPLHGFGFKTGGLQTLSAILPEDDSRRFTADSLAWSYHARRRPPLEGHTHKNCANCLEYAMQWRLGLLEAIESQRGASRPA